MDIHRRPSATAVRELLKAADLPHSDLAENTENFFGCGSRSNPEGVVGLEIYGTDALLRSLVVSESVQGQGCGKALVAAVEDYSREQGVRRIFLLTNTAERFFESLGYGVAARDTAPDGVRSSAEFSRLCPASATFMYKVLTPITPPAN